MSTLTNFLKEQADQFRSEEPERARKRDEWLNAIRRLFDQMEAWLKQADRENLLRVTRRSVEIREGALGNYQAHALTIQLEGKSKVEVLPVANHVLAPFRVEEVLGGKARGRVDLTDGLREFTLYRGTGPNEDVWVMIDKDLPRPPFLLNRETFEAALVDIWK